MGFKFGARSKDNLGTCDQDLQLILKEAILDSQVDFGISEGYRSPEDQYKAFLKGLSKIDGKKKKGKHNYAPSQAADVFAFVPGKKQLAFNPTYLAYLGGVITATANRLLREGRINSRIRWGYNWDGDGEIGTDQRFQDLPHFEIIKLK